ncbi:MAG: acetyltransferase [Zetaproteobacteria bacterium CG12_big_fil_rev_8_21_14_0_65_54_13]|nr:MAG: acetyltransferase [Zetaproteobacteria bacterium CG23_combo_of_CG06-09_8_20_14_all_54_7]PIW44196.1 MAG: acetyltransferase [Zetaproteobacteria bacterium CG12_big_fil_rev_8_21_14_0_65_54_13]PIX55255.1 MAG: acetyltransferase [Zetaproteobacteria bacterium CG_4_10_14_3_um_filter_54_28]PJA28654.1 MAG: acetyltransferase [Zetaproteobacteria bacterium CG_4_9_14_3_um_filter_54_145]
MYLRNAETGDLAHVVKLSDLTDPNIATVTVRYHAGEEAGEPMAEQKTNMAFPSGEALPECWLDAHYRVSF